MKNVILHEYKYKKFISDHLQKMIDNRYVQISDEEYNRINNAIDTYSNEVEEIHTDLMLMSFTEEQRTQLLRKIDQLEADIRALRQDTLYVTQSGLHFTDDEGNIGATLDDNGLHTIGEARDLSIIDY